MTEIVAPTGLITGQLTLVAPAQRNRLTWVGRTKTIGGPGREYWRASVALPEIDTEEMERPWRAFLFQMGMENTFRLALPCTRHIGGKPIVGAGAGNAYTLPLAGLQPDTIILKAGQFMTVPLPSGHKRAVCLTADILSNGAGEATASFRPALGEVPTTGATVETVEPYILVAPTSPEMTMVLSGAISGASFDVDEA